MFGAGETADFEDEVGDDGEVDEEDDGADKCGAVEEFVDFEWD